MHGRIQINETSKLVVFRPELEDEQTNSIIRRGSVACVHYALKRCTSLRVQYMQHVQTRTVRARSLIHCFSTNEGQVSIGSEIFVVTPSVHRDTQLHGCVTIASAQDFDTGGWDLRRRRRKHQPRERCARLVGCEGGVVHQDRGCHGACIVRRVPRTISVWTRVYGCGCGCELSLIHI